MQLIDERTAEAYLREQGRIDPDEAVEVTPLAGGVSNIVLLVSRGAERGSFVLKQARGQLRVAQPWFCSVERIWREVDVLRCCQQIEEKVCAPVNDGGPQVSTPRVVFENRENYLYAMTAAPPHVVWKKLLLDGRTDAAIASACGRYLGLLHGQTWGDERLAEPFGDRRFFIDLRVDPYYRHVAGVRADLRKPLEELADSVCAEQRALVHGDYSPKNLLVYDGGIMLVDFEVGHFGDPAFDLGFFLSHLVLKAVRAGTEFQRCLKLCSAFSAAYEEAIRPRVEAAERTALYARGVANLGGCVAARIDGKSPVDYLSDAQQGVSRGLARMLLLDRPCWEDLVEVLGTQLAAAGASAEKG